MRRNQTIKVACNNPRQSQDNDIIKSEVDLEHAHQVKANNPEIRKNRNTENSQESHNLSGS